MSSKDWEKPFDRAAMPNTKKEDLDQKMECS